MPLPRVISSTAGDAIPLGNSAVKLLDPRNSFCASDPLSYPVGGPRIADHDIDIYECDVDGFGNWSYRLCLNGEHCCDVRNCGT